ncbi:YgiQ family radical SAM protein [uncultured Megasphaera sp.]|jgi:uncharacterized radical SAM protein YgiQ|uniref:YgiQ family radical SAM protein n=2 Tax=uncultured Megasphaera sp. TaxID=165188 RepID=UPI00258F8BA6|nr:YgiQ family radical SAM protein [uncultured Megasphaera sp.]
MREKFLVTSRRDMEERGWDQLDFVYINGDAYVDHPGFAAAVIGRVLEARGYRVGIISQPDWHSAEPFKALGRPRLAALITAGNLDSMLSEKTAAKKIRNTDSYSPGGIAGKRPERATIVYANRMREAYKDVPIIIGGIEASLRRFAHYDYWSDKVRHSILLDSKADLLSYGMGEHSVVEIADALAEGKSVAEMYNIRGICYVTSHPPVTDKTVVCPSYEAVKADKLVFAQAFKQQYEEQDPFYGKTLIQQSENRYVVQTPPALPLTTEEMDAIYELPFQRRWHPDYDAAGGVPALHEVQFSLTSHRGCFGHCHFCAITSHQGPIVQNRSHESLIREAQRMIRLPDFKGYIHDVGGPTANFRHPSCQKQLTAGVCRNRHCVGSEMCPNLDTSHADYLELLREIRKLPGVKKVFVRSGLRYDYVLADNNHKFVEELCRYHVSGQLKVAPEHVVKHVTDLMGKADVQAFLTFKKWFDEANEKIGKKQYLVPYFMSSHPGCTLKDAVALAEFLRDMHMQPEQVQDFIPTPGSLSTAMYYTGINPLTGEKVYVARRPEDKQMQRALMQYKNPANYDIVHKALCLCGRRDLIGYGPKCLIPPRRPGKRSEQGSRGRRPAAAAAKARPGRRAAGVPGNHDARRGPGKKARTNHSAFR